jgi:hypothetical protein
MNEQKMKEARFDRNTTAEFTWRERLRFKIGRAVISVLVSRAIGRAYERGVINSYQMHEIAGIWSRICWPERNVELELPSHPLVELAAQDAIDEAAIPD